MPIMEKFFKTVYVVLVNVMVFYNKVSKPIKKLFTNEKTNK